MFDMPAVLWSLLFEMQHLCAEKQAESMLSRWTQGTAPQQTSLTDLHAMMAWAQPKHLFLEPARLITPF